MPVSCFSAAGTSPPTLAVSSMNIHSYTFSAIALTPNSKLENRNPKQIRKLKFETNSNHESTKERKDEQTRVGRLILQHSVFSCFELVSDFDIRVSSLLIVL